MNKLRFARQPVRLKAALQRAAQLNDVTNLYCEPERLQWLETLCTYDSTDGLVQQKELLMLLEDCRLQKKPADYIAIILVKRGTPALSRMLYRYWQYYYLDATVAAVCRYYIRKIIISEPWQKEWKKWLYVTDAPLTAARTLGAENAFYHRLCRTYLLQETSSFASRLKNLYYRFCAPEEFLYFSDTETATVLQKFSVQEQTEFLADLFRRFPLIRRDGRFTEKEIKVYTQRFPVTSATLLQHVSGSQALLLRNCLLAECIPDAVHQKYWQNYFLSSRPERCSYYYFLYPDVLEVCRADEMPVTILDFWGKNMILVVSEILPENVRLYLKNQELKPALELLSQTLSAIVIHGTHWRYLLDAVLAQMAESS